MRFVRGSTLVASLLFAAPTFADQVNPAEANMVPMIYQDESGYTGCGLRVMVASITGDMASGGEFGLTVFLRPVIGGLLKVGGLKCATPCASVEHFKYISGTEFRLSAVSDGIPPKVLAERPADDPTFTVQIIEGETAMDLLMKIFAGERMQFAYTPVQSDFRQSFTFVAKPMTSAEADSFQACLNGAIAAAEKQINSQRDNEK